jgi:hypothetical protein
MLAPALLAFVLGATISCVELITTKYPRTSFLLSRSRSLYLYALLYGLIAAGLMFGLNSLTAKGIVKLEGLGLDSAWTRAVIVGLGVKAFMHVNFVSVTVGKDVQPIGVETLTKLFEPTLLRNIDYDEWTGIDTFLQPRVTKYSDLAAVKNIAKASIPGAIPNAEREGFGIDVDHAATVRAVLELFLRFAGQKPFNHVFP